MIWVKFKSSKNFDDIMTLDKIDELFLKFNITYHLFKDSLDSCILNLENSKEFKSSEIDKVIKQIQSDIEVSKMIDKCCKYDEVPIY